MKLSAEQIKTFLRIQKKHNVSVAFILRNMPAILKFVQYAITPHIVLKRKLIRKRNRVFLRHNYLRKLIFDPSQLKKRQNVKRCHSQWSKRMVLYLRRYKMVEFFEDEPTGDAQLPVEDVSKQLKEQLELLKSGKRTVPFFEDIISTDGRGNAHTSTSICYSTEDETCGTEHCEAVKVIRDTDSEVLSNRPKKPLAMGVIDISEDVSISSTGVSTQDEPITNINRLSGGSTDRHNGNFLDMLISKVKNTSDDVMEGGELAEKLMEPPKKTVKPTASAAGEILENDERENSNSSSDFFGFDDNERIRGTFPGMLSTPLVQKVGRNSAFVSETLNAYMRDNSLESSEVVNFPQRRPEDGLVFANSIPPKLDMPAVPHGLQCLRTVAERRTFLQKNRSVKYCIINNVATIYRELQKRIKGHRINKNAIEAVQALNSPPLTRQSWKAATWLLTDEGNYYFQTITIDGKNFRLFGCRGNNQNKFKRPHSSRCGRVLPVCPDECIDRTIFRALRPIRTLERRSKLSDASTKVVYKACPLSQKILQRSDADEPAFDNLKIVRMPQVELEVFPQVQKPLNDIAKRYLQLILPYDGISREWARFSVSTLLEKQKLEPASCPDRPQSYTFPLPYANDRDHVLVRQIYSRSEAFERQFNNSNLTFRNEIDQKKALSEPTDLLARECADVLTDMLNSVAISCSENSFIKDDPDNIYEYGNNSDDEIIVEKSVKKTVELHQTGPQNKKQSRLLMELKRLNATIIDAAASKSEEDRSTCDKESCKLGCVCASLNEGTTLRQHCGKQRCILDCNCKCPGIVRLETDGRSITTEDAFMLRRQATAKLARMEKEFTSTIVLTGSETLFINESQYDKKRRCTKIPKRYGDFVDPDESVFTDTKPVKKLDTSLNITPLDPIMVKDNILHGLRHCTVNMKRLRDVNDLATWCMVHMVYKCYCKGQATVGNPIVVDKHEEEIGGTTIDEASGTKLRSFYSFEKEEECNSKNGDTSSSSETDSEVSEISDSRLSLTNQHSRKQSKRDKSERAADSDLIDLYMNAKANHCRRVVAIPRNTYFRRNKKRIARIQLYIAENETDKTRLSLNEHVLRSVYYHKKNQIADKRSSIAVKPGYSANEVNHPNRQEKPQMKPTSSSTSIGEKRKLCADNKITENDIHTKMRRRSITNMVEGSSLLLNNRYKDSKKSVDPQSSVVDSASLKCPTPQVSHDQITVPKISQIFSLNSQVLEMSTDTATSAAVDIPQLSAEAAASAEDMTAEKFQATFQSVIRNMNNLVSKKMQDIDMALRRESKTIPSPNDEILCIMRWNNFLESFTDGFVFLWEVRTSNMTFIAATIRNIMPLVMNALSVVNIRALPRDSLPLMGRMLIDRMKNTITDGLAVVMQGQNLYWFVKGFLRPDRTRICPKPTPETHPLLTKKINILCRVLINQHFKDKLKRTEMSTTPTLASSNPPQSQSNPSQSQSNPSQSQSSPSQSLSNPLQSQSNPPNFLQQPETLSQRILLNNLPPKLKILPMQRNISDATTTILEKMITLVYGAVSSNITLRKLRQNEVVEIYQPAMMNADHYWLVLDLSNDFSHIFIPELKDLLTLDRIQKVIAYAVSKSRIVKMQFRHKSLFNAYVTPMSRRKLYFGPFRNSVQTPQLVLLQSVDGQMMLREVYESRHNITTRTDKTTAFWLVQKRGELFLDVETEASTAVPKGATGADDIEEIIDNDICVIADEVSEVQPNSRQQLIEVRNIPTIENTTVDTNQHSEDDDDCIIVEAMHPASSVPTCSATPERLSYTISYTGENSSLVVIQNECEIGSSSGQDTVRSNFTILSSDVQPSLTNNLETVQAEVQSKNIPPEKEQNPLNNAQQQPLEQPNTIVKISANPTGIDTTQATISPNINVSIPTDISQALPIISTIKPSPVNVSSPLSTPNVIESSASLIENAQKKKNLDNETGTTTEPDLNKSKIGTTSSINWNKNITIKKVVMDNEHNLSSSPFSATNTQKIVPILTRKSLTVKTSPTGRVIIPSQASQNIRLSHPFNNQSYSIKRTPIIIPCSKPNTQTSHTIRLPVQLSSQAPNTIASQNVPQQVNQPNPKSNLSVAPKIEPSINNLRPSITAQRPIPTQGGITVRTPTAINTLIKNQHAQQLIRHPPPVITPGKLSVLRPAVQARPPTAVCSAPRAPSTVPTTEVSEVLPNKSHTVYLKNPLKTFVTANATNSSLAQQPQLKRLKTLELAEGRLQNKIQTLLSTEQVTSDKVTPPPTTCNSPQMDPLHIAEDASDNAADNLLQPKLPNDVKTVKITSNAKQSFAVFPLRPVPSTEASGSVGIKRSSNGIVLNCPPVRLQQAKQSPVLPANLRTNPATIVTTVSNPPVSQFKGIPIELPRLKKFSIVNSSNTTVITPPTLQAVKTPQPKEKDSLQASTSATENILNPVQKPKILLSGLVKCSSPEPSTNISNSLTKVTPSNSTNTTLNASSKTTPSANTEYGYFHASMEGLPKFVVKRVNDDFLIKVPNFNGILKLTGLTTVHNYLNQYTTQKCGKTAQDISNLKWTFKPQDRSKLNSINKCNSPLLKPGNINSPNVQKLSAVQRTESTSTSATNTANNTKAIAACVKQINPKDSIVLLDDE